MKLKRILWWGFQLTIFTLVCAGIWWRFEHERAGLAQHTIDWSKFQPAWLVVSAVLYLLGLLPCAFFWRHVLGLLGKEPPPLLATLRAYYIGHLGKYVPSKALVVFLRMWLLQGRVPLAVTAVGVFYETLTMMALGAMVALLCLLPSLQEHPVLLLLASGLAIGAGLPVVPSIFRRLAKYAGAGKAHPELLLKLEQFHLRPLVASAFAIVIGWLLLGASLAATLAAFDPALLNDVGAWRLWVAAVSLSVVAGFASLLPGGAGVREWVLMELLVPTVHDRGLALAAAIVLRIVWLLAELGISAMLYPLSGGAPSGEPAPAGSQSAGASGLATPTLPPAE